ncbi:ABC-three component system protein [Arachnia propionica]|uniref:ABC-three component system protein n=1 Tax=Arachnia propionica TaxID=1750 RepID=UPI0037BF5D9D
MQSDVYSGVIDTAEAEHATGMDRLRAVLTQSGQLDLGAHSLISVSRMEDRQGICHQLANADRLTWVKRNG